MVSVNLAVIVKMKEAATSGSAMVPAVFRMFLLVVTVVLLTSGGSPSVAAIALSVIGVKLALLSVTVPALAR